jgi:CDK-activating kinase assembly factor MAT1
MDRIFSLGPEPCPVCHVIIRKGQFRPQIFENLAVQKEVAIRKRTSKM